MCVLGVCVLRGWVLMDVFVEGCVCYLLNMETTCCRSSRASRWRVGT